MVLDAFEEKALVFTLLREMEGLGDPRYRGSPGEIAARALNHLVDKDVMVVHVDAGSRMVDVPGAKPAIIKLAVYELDLSRTGPGSGLYYHVYKVRTSGSDAFTNLFYALGDYRVRQSLSYLVEIAALYSELARRSGRAEVLIGVKDGPLVQQPAQYLSPAYDIGQELAQYALAYAGLDPLEAQRIIVSSKRRNGRVNTGLMILNILDRLAEMARKGEAIPAGVVENTSRSSSLLLYLLVELTLRVLSKVGSDNVWKLASSVEARVVEWLDKRYPLYSSCLCEESVTEDDWRELVMTIKRVMWGLFQDLSRLLVLYGEAPGGLSGLVKRLAEGKTGVEERARRSLASAITTGQLLTGLYTRDPDLVMLAYYLDILDSLATVPLRRYGPLVSAYDALERGRARENLPDRTLESLMKAVEEALGGLYMRYIVADPPPTCREISCKLADRGLGGVLDVCSVARLDSYSYAPPIRLEFYVDNPGAPGAVDVVLLESILSRYKYPYGVMIADKASRVTREEAMTARPLEERLVPLAYYIRSWEKRVEYL